MCTVKQMLRFAVMVKVISVPMYFSCVRRPTICIFSKECRDLWG